MIIKNLEISNIRIIKHIKIQFNPGFNLIFGKNASGKSSILEAITLLATGKSFRTTQFSEVIKTNELESIVVGQVDKNIIGIQKNRKIKQKINIHINQKSGFTQGCLSNYIIIQIMTPKLADLIESGSNIRRNFIDWGLFHVKQTSKKELSKFKKILKQRNALLKNPNISKQELLIWDKKFCEIGNVLNNLRKEYLKQIVNNFNENYRKFLGLDLINIEFYQGWNEQKTLSEILKENYIKDKKNKTTKSGPHLSDFRVFFGKQLAKKILSRGELKTLSFLLKIAQLDLFSKQTGKNPIVLIDDIASEMDEKNQKIILTCLKNLKTQIIITNINLISIPENTKLFHVKHGEINKQNQTTFLPLKMI